MDKSIYLDKILEFLVQDKDIDIPNKLIEKIDLWAELVSKLDVYDIPSDILINEDKFLRLELLNRNLTDAEKVKNISETLDCDNDYCTKISLWQGDITTIYADVLVNSTTKDMLGCMEGIKGTLDNSIFTRSGMRLRLKCRDIMKGNTLDVTQVLVTRAYNLPSDFIIHVVAPVVSGEVTRENEIDLKKCYLNVLECAKNNMARIVVLPCLGTGTNNFPKEKASTIAIEAVKEYLSKYESEFDKIIFNVFDDESYDIYSRLLTSDDKRA
jgi:O-acetyl-ADP-ribose deacetylase (regulator of RNase III)